MVILALCVAAGVGTVLLLPGRRPIGQVQLGGVVVLAALLILAALVVRSSAQQPGENGMGVYFWFFSAVTIVAALRVVTHPQPVYSALYFVLTVLASAGLFILLWAQFMAAALVVIYAGAILVTYVFVIMLAQQSQAVDPARPLAGLADCDQISREPVAAAAIGFALMGVLLFVIFDKAQGKPAVSPAAPNATARDLGGYLFDSQLVSVEVAGLILTLAMVGSIIIARRRVQSGQEVSQTEDETLAGPLEPGDDNPHSIPVYGTVNPRAKAYPER